MRELKFRAWDIDCQRFEYFEVGENDDCYGMFRVAANKFGSVVEQYTRLKDNNGKEIYEGDIVKAYGRVYEVAWFEKDGGWFCFGENDSVYTPLYHLKGEVIGNIHKNPELLEEEE